MDTRTGAIVPGGILDELKDLAEKDANDTMKKRLKEFTEMVIQPTPEQLSVLKVDKFDPCPCNSGKKFKWCCWTGKSDDTRLKK